MKSNVRFIKRLCIGMTVIVGLFVLQACKTKHKMIKIGVVNIVPALDYAIEGYKKGLQTLGYIEGENVEYLYDGAAKNLKDVDQLVQKLIDADVDLLVTFGNMAGVSAAKLTENTDIPVILGLSNRPEKLGIIDSLQSPGNNITGTHISGFISATFDWFMRLKPDMKKVYVQNNPDDPSSVGMLKELTMAAHAKNVELVIADVITIDEMRQAVRDIPADVDGVLAMPVALVLRAITDLADECIERKLPLASCTYGTVDNGCLLSFGHELSACGLHAAKITDRVLKGANPGEMPVENSEFFLGLNLATAAKIELEIPDVVLKRADKIVR